VKEARDQNGFGLKRYAYVSLFGQNSLNDLKDSIVEETVDVCLVDKAYDFTSIQTTFDTAKKYFSPLVLRGSQIPKLRDYVGGLGRLLFLGVRNQVVCIDDLERAGLGLRAKDVLGLISFLKDERRCKVVLLLNEEKLGEDERADFISLLEKVIDSKLEFRPTAREAADIAIDKSNAAGSLLYKDCVALGITNIRVIAKTQRLAEKLSEHLKGCHPQLLLQAMHSLTLFCWAIFQPHEAPSIEFISQYNGWAGILGDKNEIPEEEKLWRATLQSYGFSNLDDLDAAILDGVKCGFFDPEKLATAARELQKRFENQEQDEKFSAAWRKFHDSFNTSADEVLDEMASAFKDAVKTITPTNLDPIITLFKELGRPEQAQELLDYYMEKRSDEGPALFDLSDHPFAGNVKNESVRNAFAQRVAATAKIEQVDYLGILRRIATNDGWNSGDIDALGSLTADDFVHIFKSGDIPYLPSLIKAALSLGQAINSSGTTVSIGKNVVQALRQIGAENAINARRVAIYGIQPAAKATEAK
jgi:hypothetical protein